MSSNRTTRARQRKERRLPKKLQGIPSCFFGVLYPENPGTAMAPSMATGSSQDEDIPLDDSENDSTTPSHSQNGSPIDETEEGTDPAASQFYPDDMAMPGLPMEPQGSYDMPPPQPVLDNEFCEHCHPAIPGYPPLEPLVFNQNQDRHEWPVPMGLMQYHPSGQGSQHPIGTPSWSGPHIPSQQNNTYFEAHAAHTGAMDDSHYHSSHDVYTLSAQIMPNNDYAARAHYWTVPSQDESGTGTGYVHDEEPFATDARNINTFVEDL